MDASLEARPGLPDALRVLLADYPREGWRADPNFAGLVSMWLDMHLPFRDRLAFMRTDAEALLDGRAEAGTWAPRLARIGGQFVQHLHGHHSIEDHHYFPSLKARDRRLEQGFEILDRDHHAIDGHLNAFVHDANGALRALETESFHTEAGRFHGNLLRLQGFLERRLTDEEELIVPVILRYGQAGLGHG